MTTLIVNTESVPDMLSALDQLAERVAHLSTTAQEMSSLEAEEVVYHADLPRASSVHFAELLVERMQSAEAMDVMAAMVVLSELGSTFCLSDIGTVLNVPLKVVCARMSCLERIQKQLGARLVASFGGDAEGCYFYAMHRNVRDQLSALL